MHEHGSTSLGHAVSFTLLVAFVLAVVAASGRAATSGIVVGAIVPSATSISVAGCAAGVEGVTAFGTVAPGSGVVTGSDCTIGFGSSNDTASLRTWQADAAGTAMYRPPTGPLDTTWGSSGTASSSTGVGGPSLAYEARVMPDGRVVVGGAANGSGDWDVQVHRYTTTGAPDTTFDGDGRWVWTKPTSDTFADMRPQSDGKLLVARQSSGGPAAFHVARLRADGSFDPGWGSGGEVTFTLGTAANGTPRSLAVQPDGKVVVAGSATNVNEDMAVARLLANGTLDPSFGTGGSVTIAVGTGSDHAAAVELMPDGRIVLGGIATQADADLALVRLLPDGTLDTSFDGDGKLVISQPSTSTFGGMRIRDDGSVFLTATRSAGPSIGQMALVRVDGTLDPAFDSDGILELNVGTYTNFRAAAVPPDGGLVAAGVSPVGAFPRPLLVRVDESGALDPTFGTGGVVRGWSGQNYEAVTVMGDGRWLVTGESSSTSFSVGRMATTAVPDLVAGTSDWTSGTATFGACLRQAIGSGVASSWVPGTCTATNDVSWKGLALAPGAPGSTVASTTSVGTVDASVGLRFGLRTGASQPPGRYVARIAFEVVAPGA